jgi:hypothetical protein
MSERVAYLAQGKRANLLRLALPQGAPVYWLCYDNPTPIAGVCFVYDSDCTWAAGRNRLLEAAQKNARHEYFVFCDDDCVMKRGSFETFSATLLAARPAIAVPVMPKARLFGPLHNRAIQSAVVIDEQMVAIHRKAIGVPGLAPLATAFDPVSWYAACLIFEHQAFAAFDLAVQQFNEIEITNDTHTWKEPNAKYRQGNWREYWGKVRTWLGRHGDYDDRILEPYYPVFNTDPMRKDALSKTARWRLRRARNPVSIDGRMLCVKRTRRSIEVTESKS